MSKQEEVEQAGGTEDEEVERVGEHVIQKRSNNGLRLVDYAVIKPHGIKA